jgi:non-ribosomal peptide synthetase component F
MIHSNIGKPILKLFPKKKISTLKYLIFIGETIDKEIFNFWIKNVDNFINGYGPTETTVVTSYKILKESDNYKNIGKQIYNLNYYILNKNLNQVPIELLVNYILVVKDYQIMKN